MNAGVHEGETLHYPETGTPQGGVVSPLLANIYLHEVLDLWFERVVKPRLCGTAFAGRYADDAVLVFAKESDARRVLAVLAKRFGRFGLSLHPEKTRLVRCSRPPRAWKEIPRTKRPGTFDLLGFTHFWAKAHKGGWVLKRKTMRQRFGRALRAIAQWCRWHLHEPIAEQHKVLVQKILEHYGYYGIIGNQNALSRFCYEVQRTWRKWLNRRSQRARMAWDKFGKLLECYPLPAPRMKQATVRP